MKYGLRNILQVISLFMSLKHPLTATIADRVTDSSTCVPMYTHTYEINYHIYTHFIPHMAWNLPIM